jgi:hypothetical protein
VSIRRCCALLLILSASFLVSPRRAALADDWLPIDPAELKMTSEPKAPGAPAIYLYRQVDRKDLGRANVEFNYVRIKVFTEEGRSYANVEIPYLSELTHISSIRARTIHADGSIVNFEGKAFDKMIEKTKGSKIKAKVFTAPDVQVGSIVEYRFNYDFEDGYIFDSYWPVSETLFTKKALFTLVPYKEWAVRCEWPAGLPLGTEPPKQQPDRSVRMTATDIPAFQSEDFMPPENELKYRVLFVYNEVGFEQDSVKYWKKFGKKQNDRMESFIGKKKDLEAAVSQIVSPSDPPDVKLQKIYARLEQVRNLGYEAPRTEQEEKRDRLKKIDNASELLKSNYGYGSDITWAFLGLTRAAGFDSYGALVARRSEYYFNDKRMNSRELDSNVVLVNLNGKQLFFDPGSLFVPYGLLPWPETAVKGLKLDKDGGTWIVVPLPESSESQVQRSAKLKLDDDGTVEGTVKLTFIGLESWSRRLDQRNQDAEARKKFLEEDLKALVPAAVEVELSNQPDWKATEAPLVAEFTVKIPGWVSAAGRRGLLPVGFFSAAEKHTFEHANRVYPICFDYPYTKTDDVTVQLPNGWVVSSVPAAQDKDAKAAQYILKVEDKKSEVHVTRTLRSNLFMLPKENYPALRTFFQVVRSGDDEQIVLQPGTASAAH